MATKPMVKMNKSQKKKLKRLEMRQKHWEDLCRKLGVTWREANRRPGAVK
jgi:hypothetical protein